MSKTALTNTRIFDGDQIHEGKALLIDQNKIIGIISASDIPTNYQKHDLKKGLISAGFIDLQVNGGGGNLFNNAPNIEGLEKITRAHLLRGTTSLMPTVISDTPKIVQECVTAVQEAISLNPCILGIHIEGPFFNPNRRGVHKSKYVRKPSEADLHYLKSITGFPVIITLAPEQLETSQIKTLTKSGIKLLAGHSDANFDTVMNATKHGLSGFTHLYNAMGSASAREPGMMGAALSLDDTTATIIVDGHHVHHEMIKLAYRCKPIGKLIFVSDSMATVGGPKSFQLYGETIQEKNGKLVTQKGTLAGSAISLIESVQISVSQINLPLGDVLNMVSRHPAEYLGMADSIGQLRAGLEADIVHLDDDLNLLNIWKSGKPISKNIQGH